MNTPEPFDSARRDVLRAVLASGVVLVGAGLGAWRTGDTRGTNTGTGVFEVTRSEAQWHTLLGPERYAVLRQQATEPPFSSPLNHELRVGTYACAGCRLPLFASAAKFDSGTGWPSFWKALPDAVDQADDRSLGIARIEIHCRRCGGHLGHLFDDGPLPTGLRYCMNGLALLFLPSAVAAGVRS